MKVKINNAILAFPQLFEAKAFAGSTGGAKFSGSFLMDPDHPAIKDIRKAMAEVAKGKWGAKAQEVYQNLQKNDRLALHDGDTKSDYAGFAGRMFINASNALRPPVLRGNRTPIDATEGLIYPGVKVNAVIEIWAQDNQYGKRINASLLGVQFAGHGERLAGGGVASEDDFEALPDVDEGSEAFGGAGDGAAESTDDELFG